MNNVYGVDHTKLMSQLNSNGVVTNQIDEVQIANTNIEEVKKKKDLGIKAMLINQRMKKEKESKSALLQLALYEYENTKNSEKKINYLDSENNDE